MARGDKEETSTLFLPTRGSRAAEDGLLDAFHIAPIRSFGFMLTVCIPSQQAHAAVDVDAGGFVR